MTTLPCSSELRLDRIEAALFILWGLAAVSCRIEENIMIGIQTGRKMSFFKVIAKINVESRLQQNNVGSQQQENNRNGGIFHKKQSRKLPDVLD